MTGGTGSALTALVAKCAEIAEAMHDDLHLTAESTRADEAYVNGYEEACADIARMLRTILRGEPEPTKNPRLKQRADDLARLVGAGEISLGQEWVSKVTKSDAPDVAVVGAGDGWFVECTPSPTVAHHTRVDGPHTKADAERIAREWRAEFPPPEFSITVWQDPRKAGEVGDGDARLLSDEELGARAKVWLDEAHATLDELRRRLDREPTLTEYATAIYVNPKLTAADRPAGIPALTKLGWQPIETAPKSNHNVLDLWCIGHHDDVVFYCPNYCAVGRTDSSGEHLYQGRVSSVWWRDGAWRPKSKLRLHAITVTPTHWMPLPDPPASPEARLR